MIIKTWACLNRNCLKVFDSSDGDHPPCPSCGMIRVKWVPRPVAVRSSRTQQIDATVQELRQTYGDRNYRSAQRGQSMAPKVNGAVGNRSQRFTPAASNGMGGWAADIPLDANGNFVAHCAPTGVSAKVSAKVGQRAVNSDIEGRKIGVGGNVEYAHRPPGGIPR